MTIFALSSNFNIEVITKLLIAMKKQLAFTYSWKLEKPMLNLFWLSTSS